MSCCLSLAVTTGSGADVSGAGGAWGRASRAVRLVVAAGIVLASGLLGAAAPAAAVTNPRVAAACRLDVTVILDASGSVEDARSAPSMRARRRGSSPHWPIPARPRA
jgi:hypothetical protein